MMRVKPFTIALPLICLAFNAGDCWSPATTQPAQQPIKEPLASWRLDRPPGITLSSDRHWVAYELANSQSQSDENQTGSKGTKPPQPTTGIRNARRFLATALCQSHAALDDGDRAIAVVATSRPANEEADVQFLATRGCFDNLLTGLNQLSARVKFVDHKLGFVHVAVPPTHLLDALDVPGADYAAVPLVQTRPDSSPIVNPKPASLPTFTIPFPRVALSLPPGGPYFPAEEAGLNKLWHQYPGANGSRTRIALVDGGLDLLHPAMQRVKNKDGSLLPKIADLDTATAPGDDSGWVRFGKPIPSVHRTITAANKVWKVPADGVYNLGLFAMNLTVGSFADPGAKKVTLTVGVLWDRKRDLVWVDTDGDGDFTNNRALRDYAERQDIDFFGRVDRDQDNRIPFGVKTARAQNAVYISIGSDHGALVVGTAVANRLTQGLFDGAAPQAQVIDMRFNSLSTILPGMIKAASRPDVDVVNRSGGVGGPVLMEFQRHVLKRLVEVYKKPVVCVCAVPGTISVGDYQSPEMLRRNRQLQHPPFLESLYAPSLWFIDEGIENGIVAPSTSLTTQSRYQPLSYVGSDGLRHISPRILDPPAPAGYAIGANSSPAISLVSGIIADLISLARQKHVRYDATRLANAVFTGAPIVPGFPASVQGHGRIDAANAWQQLEAMSRADDPRNPVLTTFDVTQSHNRKKSVVYGYSEEFMVESGAQTRELWVTRRGGFRGARSYRLRLRGDDGTFALVDTSVVLDRDRASRIRFTVRPTFGLHVAFLQLVDEQVGVAMQQIPLESQTPERPEAVAPGVERYRAEIPPRKSDTRFVHLADGIQAMHVIVEKPNVGSEILPYQRFWNRSRGVFLQLKRRTEQAQPPLDAPHHVGPMDRYEALVADPPPGIWQVYWDNRAGAEYETPYDPPAPDVPVTGRLTLKKYAVSLSRTDSNTIAAHNRLAEIEGRVEFFDGALTTRELEGTGSHGLATTTTQVPARTAMWRVTVEWPTNRTEVADVYALNCAENPRCHSVRQESFRNGRATLSIAGPQAGTWRIVVLQRQPGTKGAIYKLHEALLTPIQTKEQGALRFARHASGSDWLVPVPAELSNPQAGHAIYAAFRTAPAGGEAEGQLIAVIPLLDGAR